MKERKRISTTNEWLTLRSLHSIPLSYNNCKDGTRMQQNQHKTGRKNSWKTQGTICICHHIHKDKTQIALLRSTLAAIWGFQGKRSDVHLQNITDIDFSLIRRPTSWMMVSMTGHQLCLWNKWLVLVSRDFLWNSTLELNTSFTY